MPFGKRPEEPIGTRDAGHVAFVVIEADDTYDPGEKVVFTDRTYSKVRSAYGHENHHGIVDPFGERVLYTEPMYVLLRPGIHSKPLHSFEIDLDIDDEDEDRWRGCAC